MRQLIPVANVNVSLDTETHSTAKAAAAIEGVGFYRWVVRSIRRAAGLSDEVLRVPENQTSTPATPLADVEVSKVSGGTGSGVSGSRASVQRSALKRKPGKVQL